MYRPIKYFVHRNERINDISCQHRRSNSLAGDTLGDEAFPRSGIE